MGKGKKAALSFYLNNRIQENDQKDPQSPQKSLFGEMPQSLPSRTGLHVKAS